MSARLFANFAVAAVGTLLLGGCSGDLASGWGNRYGPNPALPADQIAKSAENQAAVITALATVSHDSSGRVDSYLLTLAGFNYVDEQCDAYLHELFLIDQDRDRLKSGLNAAGAATSAVLAATSASTSSMAIVAQAFGLSSEFTDVAANGYLYGSHPATIFGVVSKLQSAYRDQASKDKALIASEPAAYGRIRGYLQLCLPPTIEAKINEALASTTAVSGKDATGTNSAGPGTSQATKLVAPQ